MIKFIIFLVFIYFLACLILYVKQRDLMYFPTPEAYSTQAQEIWIDSHQHRLKLWQMHQKKPAIIYFGGNAEAVENNISGFGQALAEYTVYLVNYRGFGGSSGKPSEQALFEDALTLYDAIKDKHSSISVIGRSLGSGVAIYLATQRKIDKVALVTPYDSIKNVAKSHYPVFPVSILLKDCFDSVSRSEQLTQPVLILLADHDVTVPRKNSESLIAALKPEQVETQIIVNSDHGSISSHAEYFRSLSVFFDQGK
jgi:uncharacterized protein